MRKFWVLFISRDERYHVMNDMRETDKSYKKLQHAVCWAEEMNKDWNCLVDAGVTELGFGADRYRE